MSSLDELMRRMQCAFEEQHIHEWLHKGWIAPRQVEGAPEFDEIDIARATLIHTLRVELAIDEEALPVILSLLDQLHGTRRIVRRIAAILESQPDELRAEIAAVLQEME